jgi:hypothetical protein
LIMLKRPVLVIYKQTVYRNCCVQTSLLTVVVAVESQPLILMQVLR